jgi:predicted dehydrogenase
MSHTSSANTARTADNLQGKISRREAIKSATALAAFTIVPRHVLGGPGRKPPGEKLNLAFIGVAGRAKANLKMLEGENVVALCDVDQDRLAGAQSTYPGAKPYRDFRKMLDEMEKSIDAVVVSTPDHTHAVAALAAMGRGKHVYCEKPLAHSIREVRTMARVARARNVATQLGNQGHSWPSTQVFCEWVRRGAIGAIREIHAFCGSNYGRIRDLPRLKEETPVPPALDWNLWLGPAQFRPYSPLYVPSRWRGWTPFGTGTLGDWICHVVDPVFLALDLGSPVSIEAQAKDYDPKVHGDTFPNGVVIRYEFAARGQRGPVTLTYYDGEEKRARMAEFEGQKLPAIGAVVVGDQGKIIYDSHGAREARIVPEDRMKGLPPSGKTEWETTLHHRDWLNAIRGGRQAGANFGYGATLSEIALLGVIAIRMLGRKLEWDGKAGQFIGNAEANQFLNPPYREGWALPS